MLAGRDPVAFGGRINLEHMSSGTKDRLLPEREREISKQQITHIKTQCSQETVEKETPETKDKRTTDRKERGTHKREQEKAEEKGEAGEVGHESLLCYVICPLVPAWAPWPLAM